MAEPAPPTHPSLLRRPGCWMTFLSVIPLLIGGIYVLENWFGARALARARAEVAAAGIELDPKLLPWSRPPDTENFCATPLLLDLAAGAPSDPEWETIRRLGSWHRIASEAGARMQSPRHPAPTDWTAVRDAVAQGDPQAALDASATPADALSMSLGADLEPVLKELSDVLDRPHSAIVPSSLDRMRAGHGIFDGGFRMGDVRSLAAALVLHAALYLDGAEPTLGLQSLKILLKLAEGTENYGDASALLIGSSIRALVHNLVWSAAARRTLPAALWCELSALLRAQHPLDRLPLALQRETLFVHLAIDQIRGDSSTAPLPGSASPSGPAPWVALASVLPRGWVDANEAFVLNAYAETSRQIQDASRPDRFVLNDREPPRHHIIGRIFFIGPTAWIRLIASSQAISRLAETACALEAHFADRQSYPESLDVLVPAYLPSLPLDLDEQPIRYAPDPTTQRYRLWSIGADGRDDKGAEMSNDGSSPSLWREPVGDWLWHYPP